VRVEVPRCAWREEIRAQASTGPIATPSRSWSTAAGRGWPAASSAPCSSTSGRSATCSLGEQGPTEKGNTSGARDVLRSTPAPPSRARARPTCAPGGARLAGRGDVLHTVTGGLTTQDLDAAERRLIAAAISRAGEGAAVVDQAPAAGLRTSWKFPTPARGVTR
jgi:hypothetical protein